MQRKHLAGLGVLVAAVGVLLLPATGQAGGGPVLSWSPSGNYDLGSSGSSHSFTLTNSGGSATSALVVNFGGANASQFSISNNTCSGTSLGPKKHCSVTVTYTEAASGKSDTATLTAMSKKPAANASVTLTGNTRLSPTLSLTFSPDPAYTGDTVSAQAALHDATATAGGTATYLFYSTGDCSPPVSTQTASVTNGSIPASSTQPPVQAGSWSWKATYSGDSGNNNATSPCVEMDVTSPPANLVPNPGFEDACSGIPCHWSAPLGFGVISRDTNNPHSGSASVRVNATGGPGSANSDCITISPNTTYNISGWYRTTTTGEPTIGINEYSDASCSQPDGNDSVSPSSLNFTNTWSLFGGPLTTVSDAASAQVFVEIQCQCLGGGDMNWDDVSLTQAP